MDVVQLQDDLCKSFRAAGIPKGMTHQLTNQICTWIRSSGTQWTVDRLKGYRQWYETYLAGSPTAPAWFRSGEDGLPTGIWKAVFRFRNPARALAVFSAGTLLKAREITPTQRDKFSHGLEGNGHVEEKWTEVDREAIRWVGNHLRRSDRNSENRKKGGYNRGPEALDLKNPPTSGDMTAMSIPVGRRIRRVTSQADREEALLESWEALPEASRQYLEREEKEDWIPLMVKLDIAFDSVFQDGVQVEEALAKHLIVGRIGFIQEPELKLRSVANPNRISQALTKPLADVWDSSLSRFQTDCTYNQDAGVRWVQRKLKEGMTLAGSDMSSATDLLGLSECLVLAGVAVKSDWLPPHDNRGVTNLGVIAGGPNAGELRLTEETMQGRYGPIRAEDVERYNSALKHFKDLSRGLWCTPDSTRLGDVQWRQGQPLGLYPSFRLLAIANNAIASMAAHISGLDPDDSFRVIGDDIIMDQAMEPEYIRLIHQIGGEVNASKTLTSSQVAEFAGRIVLPERVLLKRIKFGCPSDDSFMQIVSDLGPQAVSLLRPRQRKQWERFRNVPGAVLDGPWMKSSFGEPLQARIDWALTRTDLFDQDLDADPEETTLEADYLASSMRGSESRDQPPADIAKMSLPASLSNSTEGYLPPGDISVPKTPRPSGDPRHPNGKSMLEHLEHARVRETYEEYVGKPSEPVPPGTDEDDPDTEPSVREGVHCTESHAAEARRDILAEAQQTIHGAFSSYLTNPEEDKEVPKPLARASEPDTDMEHKLHVPKQC